LASRSAAWIASSCMSTRFYARDLWRMPVDTVPISSTRTRLVTDGAVFLKENRND
jgi:hypothetical protein